MKTTVSTITDLVDGEGKDVILSMVVDGDPGLIEASIMSQSKVRMPLNDGFIYLNQSHIKAITFRQYSDPDPHDVGAPLNEQDSE